MDLHVLLWAGAWFLLVFSKKEVQAQNERWLIITKSGLQNHDNILMEHITTANKRMVKVIQSLATRVKSALWWSLHGIKGVEKQDYMYNLLYLTQTNSLK